MSMTIQNIPLNEFDLSLSEIRIMHYERALKVEKSMKVHGQLQTVVVRACKGFYQLIDGFKRYYAAEILLMDTLECRVLDVSLAQAKILLLSYNRTIQTMEVWEEAMVLQDLKKTHDMDQKQLAKLTGRSRSWVSRRLSLISRIDEEVACDIRMGTLTGSHARSLMKLPRANQKELAQAITRWGLSTRQSTILVEAWLKQEDATGREYLLEHPDLVIRNEEYCEYPYDGRLSSYGNELKYFAKDVVEAIHCLLTHMNDERMGQLSQPEEMIITPYLQQASQSSQKFTEAISHLPITKPSSEHEK